MLSSTNKIDAGERTPGTKRRTVSNFHELLTELNRQRPNVIVRKVSMGMVSQNPEEPLQ
jgi:hypothetical protein